MFSKEEARLLRQEFWISFGKSFPRKWLLYDTKIKGFSFKFHFDTQSALVALDIDAALEQRIIYWERVERLRQILLNDYLPNAHFDDAYLLENGKELSRVYVLLDAKVSIHNKQTWQEVMVFFNATMAQFEAFFEAYEAVIRD